MDLLSIASAQHKSQIASSAPWHVLLTVWPDPINLPGTVLRLARSPENLVYRGNTYLAFAFDFDVLWDKSSGELQSLKLTISNINRVVQGYLNQYNGCAGMTVQLDVVSGKDMTGDPAQSYSFGVQSSSSDATWVTLTLGGANPTFRTFLRFLYFPDYCQWIYNDPALQAVCDPRGAYCGYWGALTTCTHHLADCKNHNNVSRFGGYPGVGTQGFLSTTPT